MRSRFLIALMVGLTFGNMPLRAGALSTPDLPVSADVVSANVVSADVVSANTASAGTEDDAGSKLATKPVSLSEILACLDKSRILLESDDRAGCRAILRELKVKLAESNRPLIKQIRSQVQYIQLKLWMHMSSLAHSHLIDLIETVRQEIRDRNP